MTEVWTTTPTPLGDLLLVAVDGGLTKAHFAPFDEPPGPPSPGRAACCGRRRASSASTSPASGPSSTCRWRPPGTAFQQRVWDELTRIPYGTTTTYGEIALRLGDPEVRARRRARERPNPIAVVVPCHRVIGADGKLRGYAAGVERKQRLLALEQASLF